MHLNPNFNPNFNLNFKIAFFGLIFVVLVFIIYFIWNPKKEGLADGTSADAAASGAASTDAAAAGTPANATVAIPSNLLNPLEELNKTDGKLQVANIITEKINDTPIMPVVQQKIDVHQIACKYQYNKTGDQGADYCTRSPNPTNETTKIYKNGAILQKIGNLVTVQFTMNEISGLWKSWQGECFELRLPNFPSEFKPNTNNGVSISNRYEKTDEIIISEEIRPLEIKTHTQLNTNQNYGTIAAFTQLTYSKSKNTMFVKYYPGFITSTKWTKADYEDNVVVKGTMAPNTEQLFLGYANNIKQYNNATSYINAWYVVVRPSNFQYSV